jgi:hypothetical protein
MSIPSYADITKKFCPPVQRAINPKGKKNPKTKVIESLPLIPERFLSWTIYQHIHSILMKIEGYRNLFRKLKISPLNDKFQWICEYYGEDQIFIRFPMNEFSNFEDQLHHARYEYRELNKIALEIVSYILEQCKTPEIFFATMISYYKFDH